MGNGNDTGGTRHEESIAYEQLREPIQSVQDAIDHLQEVEGFEDVDLAESIEQLEDGVEGIEDAIDECNGDATTRLNLHQAVDDLQVEINDLQDGIGYDDPELAEAVEDVEEAMESVEDELEAADPCSCNVDELEVGIGSKFVDAPERFMTPKEVLQLHGRSLNSWYLYEYGAEAGDDEYLPGDTPMDLCERNRFTAISDDVGYGSPAQSALVDSISNDYLRTHIQELTAHYEVEVREAPENGFTHHVIVKDWEIPSDAYNKERTNVMIRISENYPHEAPDWVYVEEDLELEGGGSLRKEKSNKVDGWLALSWHISKLDGVTWDHQQDDLQFYLEYVVHSRLAQGD